MKRFVFAAVLALAVASVAVAGTTGKLSGIVTDDQGQPVPGATVSASSPAQIGGAQIAVTDADGSFSFPGLAPGVYSVKIELTGFVAQERTEVQVRLDRTTELRVTMPAGTFGEEVTVVAETPVVDPTQVSTAQTFTNDYLKFAAVGTNRRSYQSVLSMAPGVVGTGNPNVYGSTESENAYYIDGHDTTDPVTATFGTNFNFDAIQEISFQTGGFEAEYGRATGGLVNVVTKSGGNELSGTLDVRYRETGFYENGDHFNRDTNEVKYVNPAVTLGGPIMRDRLWFFAAYQSTDSQSTPVDSPTTRKFLGDYWLGKLTWQISPSWNLAFKYSSDPADIDNVNAAYYVAPEANYFQTQGGDIYQADMSTVLSPSLLWNVRLGVYSSNLDAYAQNGDFDTASHENLITGYLYGAYDNAQYSTRDRDDFTTDLTWFVDQLGGSHELKAGVEYSPTEFSSHNYTAAGFRYDDLTEGYWYEDDFNGNGIDDNIPYLLWNDTDPGPATFDGTLQTVYLQDAWRVAPNFTVKLGVRYDTVSYDDDAGETVADMDMVQPRLGVAWDVAGNARSVLKASWGRFMHPNALQLPSFARTGLSTSYRWRSCSTLRGFTTPEECQAYAAGRGYAWDAGPDGWDGNGWYTVGAGDTFGSAPNEIDPGLEPTYADELIVGFEQQIANRTSIELSYVDKSTRDVFEDTCNGNVPTPSADAACDYYLMANLSDLKRDYQGAILKFESRATDWMYLLASYTWSKSEGSVENRWNAAVDFDIYPDHFVNMYGYLSDDRTHRVKLNGYFMLPLNFTIGVDAYWSSAFAYSRTAPAPSYGDEYLDPRGAHRANDNYQLDLSASWGPQLGPIRLELIGVVYNVFGSEQVNGVCDSDTGCGGDIAWGDPDSWQTPRRYELGFRIEF
jgi:outer membrane receptor protein involved in Fe transport